jgi:hypothetical protein
VVAWTVLSCPTKIYQQGINFFHDAFIMINITSEQVSQWTITLYNQDVRVKNGFAQRTHNFISGAVISGNQSQVVSTNQSSTASNIQQSSTVTSAPPVQQHNIQPIQTPQAGAQPVPAQTVQVATQPQQSSGQQQNQTEASSAPSTSPQPVPSVASAQNTPAVLSEPQNKAEEISMTPKAVSIPVNQDENLESVKVEKKKKDDEEEKKENTPPISTAPSGMLVVQEPTRSVQEHQKKEGQMPAQVIVQENIMPAR